MRDKDVPLDEVAFTTFMADWMGRVLPDWRISTLAPLSLTIIPPQGAAGTCNLDRALEHCLHNRRGCAQWLEGYIEQLSDSVKDALKPIDRGMLRIVVRPKDYIDEVQQAAAERGEKLAVENLTDDLVAVCYIDLPTALRSADTADFRKLGMTVAEALAQAKANQAAGLRDFQATLEDFEGGIGVLEGDVYQSSWFALPEAWAEFAARARADLLVAVPAQEVLLYTRDTGKVARSALAATALETGLDDERPLSPEVYRWTRSGWKGLS